MINTCGQIDKKEKTRGTKTGSDTHSEREGEITFTRVWITLFACVLILAIWVKMIIPSAVLTTTHRQVTPENPSVKYSQLSGTAVTDSGCEGNPRPDTDQAFGYWSDFKESFISVYKTAGNKDHFC